MYMFIDMSLIILFFFFKQKTAYEMRISDWSSDVCSSDLNAEDPFKFTPSPGRITNWHVPGGPGVRMDSHVFGGYRVPPNYDSMIAKLITYGDTRAQAIARMDIALSEMAVDGVLTNIPLHRELMQIGRAHV